MLPPLNPSPADAADAAMATGLGLLERLLLGLKGARCAGEEDTWEAEKKLQKEFSGLQVQMLLATYLLMMILHCHLLSQVSLDS